MRFPSPWLLIALLATAAAVTLLAPEERTLAAGIRPVYVHVALTWTGMLLLVFAALLGLLAQFNSGWRGTGRQADVFLLGLAFFGLGFCISLLAGWVNWGGIPLREPRFILSVNVLVLGLLAFALGKVLAHPRLSPLLLAVPVILLLASTRLQSFGLHPQGPVASAPLPIRGTFYLLFLVFLGCAGWLLCWLTARRSSVQ